MQDCGCSTPALRESPRGVLTEHRMELKRTCTPELETEAKFIREGIIFHRQRPGLFSNAERETLSVHRIRFQSVFLSGDGYARQRHRESGAGNSRIFLSVPTVWPHVDQPGSCVRQQEAASEYNLI